MRLSLRALWVLCPFFLNAVYAEDEEHSYYLEEEVADEMVYLEEEVVDVEEEDVQPYSLDEIADEEDFYEDSLSMNEDDQSSVERPSEGCLSPNHKMHVGLRHIEARGVGYHSGYTTLEGFGIYDRNNHFMPFLDLRGHVFDNGKFAGNIGIGERTALFSISHLLGIYCYYDVRQETHGFTVNQISPGIELVGSRMEYRLNGYFPVARKNSHKYDTSFDKFHDNNIIIKRKQKKALTGGDAEIGVHMTQSTKYDLYGAAGTYYFSASDTSSWGGKARLMGRYKEYVTLEASYSYDRLFHSIVQGTVAFNLPFGGKLKRRDKNCEDKNSLWFSRAAFAPQRFEIPVVKKVTHKSKAINPATGKPWRVWFVNNTSHSNGTYESPFPTLLQAQNASAPNDMIYVFPGNGTTSGMNAGIVLKSTQKLFGSGIAHKIATTKGKITIPRFSSTYPVITNATGDVVDLNSGNEVSGMNIVVTNNSSSGIGTLLGSINGANIHNNIISANVASNSNSGILLFALGKVTVNNNQIFAASGNASGIAIVQQGTLQFTASNNSIAGCTDAISILGPSTAANLNIQNNSIANFSGIGIIINSVTSGQTSIADNNIYGPGGTLGIKVLSSPIHVSISGNHVAMGGTGAGITVDTTGSSAGASSRVILSNNDVATSSSAATGILLKTVANTSICSSLTGNIVAPGPTAAFSFTSSGSTGPINIDALEDNVGGPVAASGSVNLVAPDSCGP